MSGSPTKKMVKEFYSSDVAKRTRAKRRKFEDVIFGMMRRRRNDEVAPANRGSGAVPTSIPQRSGERSATMDIEGVEVIDEFEFRRTTFNMGVEVIDEFEFRKTTSNMEHSASHSDLEEIDSNKIVDDKIVDDELRNLAKVSSADNRESSYSKDAGNGTNQERLQKSTSFIHRAIRKDKTNREHEAALQLKYNVPSSPEVLKDVTDPLPEALRYAEEISAQRLKNNTPAEDNLAGVTQRGSSSRPNEVDESEENRIRLLNPERIITSPLKPIVKLRRTIKTWSLEEENTLIEEVKTYGEGQWTMILLRNKELFNGRTNVDLKDKWRNLKLKGVTR